MIIDIGLSLKFVSMENIRR